MKVNRRDFLKKAIIGLGATVMTGTVLSVLGGRQLSDSDPSSSHSTNTIESSSQHVQVPDDPARHWGFIIDLAECDGCEGLEPASLEDDPTGERFRCSLACRASHYYAQSEPPMFWIRVYVIDEESHVPPYYFPKPCQNCQDAPCVRVCPTGASYYRKDMTVIIDHRLCIGCRMCMAACPYESRFFWFMDPVPEGDIAEYEYSPEFPVPYSRGTVVKCDMCVHRAYMGQLPACVPACPRGALYYGDLNESALSNGRDVIDFHQVIEDGGGYRFKEEEGTEPSIYYLPPSTRGDIKEKKHQTVVNVEIGDSQEGENLSEVIVHASTGSGTVLRDAKVIVRKKTTYGLLSIGEGKTDSDGTFKCFAQLPRNRTTTIVAELIDRGHNARSEVIKRGK
ncbi:MAG: 4Fe-4S dicluster domain-containing protein [Candidatus Hodarchaeales archaeon]|jgi:molybdopterin-containing oxidoreductase family iron-sulfur binding subunit